MLNDRVVYKQDGGDNWLFYDTEHFCIGENPDIPCEEQGILAENVPDQQWFIFFHLLKKVGSHAVGWDS